MKCPICDGTRFGPYRARPVARCEQCHSLERGRLLWMVLDRMKVLRPKMRVLHLAPEGAIGNRLFELYGSSYKATDYDVPRYSKWKFEVSQLDACCDLVNLPSASFDLILHNHVLEHLPCSVEAVLAEMTRLLAPGGWHFLSVPFRRAQTEEDLGDLTPEQRIELFGQYDHMRMFGTKDFPALLSERFNIEPVKCERWFSVDEIVEAGIPFKGHDRIDGNSIFVGRAREVALARAQG
jgi:SAM-dependent methyltransferase